MAGQDGFVYISRSRSDGTTGGDSLAKPLTVAERYFDNAKGDREFTEGLIVDSIRRQYPKHHLTVSADYFCDLIAFANGSDDVSCSPHAETALLERRFIPSPRRYNADSAGSFNDNVVFGSFDYVHAGNSFLVFVVRGVDGCMFLTKCQYILVAPKEKDTDMTLAESAEAQRTANDLIAAATTWSQELHNEVLVFDNGFWQKSPDLWQNVQKSRWEDVILEKSKKKAIIDDVIGFFNAQERYKEFGIPWKRGVILYGPPGNGKTISTKALMHDLSKRRSPTVECLYVKTFNSYGGPEFGIRQIFLKAREMAPCLLIFEDIDSLVNVVVRSYFLNEVDGLESNHGILMIASTNHLERLDPGIAKRPSRFDRKYLFDVPTRDERIQYCEYWRHKLRSNKKIDFPKQMCGRIADITGGFSFAYMKESFVAALMVIVGNADENRVFRHRDDDLTGNILWEEIQKQIKNLRKEMDDEGQDSGLNMSGLGLSLNTLPDDRRAARPIDISRAGMMPRYL